MAFQLPRPDDATLEEIVYLPNDQKLDKLEQDICSFVQSNRMSEEMYESRTQLVNIISDYLKSETIARVLGPQGFAITALTAFGSCATHCATHESDLDLCVCAWTEVEGAQPLTVLQTIHDDLEHNPEARGHFRGHTIGEIVFVKTAKVPIIKFKIDEVPVDLSVTLDMGPPRSSLAARYINAYCALDERFAVLAVFLKLWMRSEGSSVDHLRDYPNSYSLIMLLIHCLQWYGILPLLNEQSFWNDYSFGWNMMHLNEDFKCPVDENMFILHGTMWTSQLSVVQLLRLFAYHYADEGMVSGHRFNMENGEIEQRRHTFRSHPPIQILDGYDTRNPARTTRSSEHFIGSLRNLLNVIDFPTGDLFSQVLVIPQEQLSQWSMPQMIQPPAGTYFTESNRHQYQDSRIRISSSDTDYSDSEDRTATIDELLRRWHL